MKETTLCYIEQNGSYLLLHRVKKEADANRGKWIGIGGKIESGESPEDCLLREVREETGLTLTRYRYRGKIFFESDEYPAELMHLYQADGFSGEIMTDCREGILAWVGKEKIASLPMWQGDRIFLDLLLTDEPFFVLRLRYRGEELDDATLNGKPLPTR